MDLVVLALVAVLAAVRDKVVLGESSSAGRFVAAVLVCRVFLLDVSKSFGTRALFVRGVFRTAFFR